MNSDGRVLHPRVKQEAGVHQDVKQPINPATSSFGFQVCVAEEKLSEDMQYISKLPSPMLVGYMLLNPFLVLCHFLAPSDASLVCSR